MSGVVGDDPERGDDGVAVQVRVVDEEARVGRIVGMEGEPEQTALAAAGDPVRMSRNGRSSARTRRGRSGSIPACSTTNRRPLPSPASATSTGELETGDRTVSRRDPLSRPDPAGRRRRWRRGRTSQRDDDARRGARQQRRKRAPVEGTEHRTAMLAPDRGDGPPTASTGPSAHWYAAARRACCSIA